MLFSKEYVGYLAREVSKKLVASGLIETKAMPALPRRSMPPCSMNWRSRTASTMRCA